MNKIILLGNLARENELKYLPSGSAVCSNSIAVTKKYKNKQGQLIEKVLFIDLVVFMGAEVFEKFTHRGSKVLIEGELELDQWKDNNGQNRQKHKINVKEFKFLDCKKSTQSDNQPSTQQKRPAPKVEVHNSPLPDIDVDESEIPF